MRILTCRNSIIPRLHVHFETLSAMREHSASSAFRTFSRMPPVQVNDPARATHGVGWTGGAPTTAPICSAVGVGHLIVDHLGLQRAGIGMMQSQVIIPLPGGGG